MKDWIAINAVWPGKSHPRGATWDGHGVNFALFSEHAERVQLCLFDIRGHERQTIEMPERTDHVWHCYLPQARPGLAYGYRVAGPYRPQDGHRFNPHKLVLDPYARDFVGSLRWNDALYGYTVGHKKGDLSFDFTGCGNTLNAEHPRVLQLVMDSLRYWAQEMHVDGFRFDLASALARERGRVEHLGGFFDAVRQDPVLNGVKLVAEPWDLGHGGYQVGNFPLGWAEWNDRYRDGVRAYWKGDAGKLGEFARRLTGSFDLYGGSGKRPNASINFVAAHDGFTLHDLVSYNDKHNEANGEDNRDGHNHNLSWNCGAEGPTDDTHVLALRQQQKRNLLATLLLSQGVPMWMTPEVVIAAPDQVRGCSTRNPCLAGLRGGTCDMDPGSRPG